MGKTTRLQNRRGRLILVAGLFWLAAISFAAPPAHAYVGPGAGFAVLSSFLAVFLAFLYAMVALVTWPLRQLGCLLRGRRAYGRAKVKRAVVIGLDGMDPELAARFMDEGKLPNFAVLRARGTFRKLRTTHPPISPVAWSTFLTGVNPGKHNIYDFLAPDRQSYLPYLSSAQVAGPRRRVKLGKYSIPLGRPQIKRLRKARPFWHYLGEAGIFCSVIRVPITFPPEKFPGVLLAGMCVPDVKGSQGTFSLHTTRALAAESRESGVVLPIEQHNGRFRSYVPGPDHPLKAGAGELRIPFRVRRDPARGQAVIEIAGRSFALKPGEYSGWVELKFRAGWGVSVHGICRFYLSQLHPELEVYVTPVNLHPQRPALPISHPLTYALYLSKLLGPFATLGLAEDTWALNEGAIGDDGFLAQCYLNHSEREQMFFDALGKTSRGLCVCVWDTTDRVQHMFWRYLEPGHPAASGVPEGERRRYAGVIEELYRRMDDLIGRTLARIDDQTLLLVVSDHGFTSFARGVNVNSWLWQNGYLALKPGARQSGEWFRDVDWSRTRAYCLGLNGLYLNLQGRERDGTVSPGQSAESLKREIREMLQGLADPATGKVAIPAVWLNEAVFAGPYRENGPDLLIGYSAGYRASWECVTGKVTPSVFDDNTKAWSGDHCVDARLVPGVLFANHKILADHPAIVDVAPTLLDVFGLPRPAHFDGSTWSIEFTSLPGTLPAVT